MYTFKILLKSTLKSKLSFLIPFFIMLITIIILFMNMSEMGQTKQDLLEEQKQRMIPLDFVISQFYEKKSDIGLTELDEEVLINLENQSDIVNKMINKLEENDLDISSEMINYVDEYEKYNQYEGYIQLEFIDQLVIEREKAETINENGITYLEEVMPYNSSLFFIQMIQIFMNPLTIILLLLIANYKYKSDQRNKIFEWMQLNAVSKKSIISSFYNSFIVTVFLYAVITISISILPMIFTGNFSTIHYPIELFSSEDTSFIPAWKFLLFIPIGWLVFSVLALYINMILTKITESSSLAFVLTIFFFASFYFLNYNSGFKIWNPIHLIINYEQAFFIHGHLIDFIICMLILIIILKILSYFLLKVKSPLYVGSINKSYKTLYKPNKHFKLLSFEILRKKRNQMLYITIAITSVLSIGYSLNINQEYEKIPIIYHESLIDYRDELIRNGAAQETLLFETEYRLESAEKSGQDRSIIEELKISNNLYSQMVDDTKLYIDEINKLLKNIGANDFDLEYRALFDTLRQNSNEYEIENPLGPSITQLSTDEMNQYFEKRSMRPWPIGDTQISNFNNPYKNDESFETSDSQLARTFYENNRNISNDTLFTMQKYLQNNIPLILIALFILLIWSSFSDIYKPHNVYDFVFTKPFTNRVIFFNKSIFNLFSSYLLLFIGIIILIAISGLIGGFGDIHYPVVIYEHVSLRDTLSDSSTYSKFDSAFYRIDTIGSVLIESFIILLLVILFIVSLHSVIGRFSKNHYFTTILTLVVLVIGYSSTALYGEANWMWMNPFIYFDVWDIADGWQSIVVNDARVNFNNSVMILSISSVFLLIVGLISNRKWGI